MGEGLNLQAKIGTPQFAPSFCESTLLNSKGFVTILWTTGCKNGVCLCIPSERTEYRCAQDYYRINSSRARNLYLQRKFSGLYGECVFAIRDSLPIFLRRARVLFS